MSVASEITRLQNAKSALKTSINLKTDAQHQITTETLDDYAGFVDSIQTGGGVVKEKVEEGVNFFDYDGTILDSYNTQQALALNSLPDLPDVKDNLVAQEWNWTLAKIKSYLENYGGRVDVCCTRAYNQDDTKFVIELTQQTKNVYLTFKQTIANDTLVDWGDGSPIETFSTYGSTFIDAPHTYNFTEEKKLYTVTLTSQNGTILFEKSTTTGMSNASTLNIETSSGSRSSIILKEGYLGKNTTAMNNGLFYNVARNLEKIYIASTVDDRIRSNTFQNCINLELINIPNNITLCAKNSFTNCYSLRFCGLPKSISNSGGSDVFYYCYALKNISLPEAFRQISGGIFRKCFSLEHVTIPEGASISADYNFSECTSLKKLIVPKLLGDSLNTSSFARDNSSLQELIISDDITKLGGYLLYGNYGVRQITLPSKLTTLTSSSFSTVYNLESIKIPKGVIVIPSSTFQSDSKLSKIDFSSHETVPTLDNINAFSGLASNFKIYVPSGLETSWKNATNWATYADNIVGV